MQVNKLDLLEEVSRCNRADKREKSESSDIAIHVQVSKVDNRPWSNEVDVIIKVQRSDSGSVIFFHQASYAAEFDEDVIEGDSEPAKVVWPLIREGIVSQFRKFGVNVHNVLPYNLERRRKSVG